MDEYYPGFEKAESKVIKNINKSPSLFAGMAKVLKDSYNINLIHPPEYTNLRWWTRYKVYSWIKVNREGLK